MHANLDHASHMTSKYATDDGSRLGPGNQYLSVNGQKGAFGQTNYSGSQSRYARLHQSAQRSSGPQGCHLTPFARYIGTRMVMAIPKDVLDSKIIPQSRWGVGNLKKSLALWRIWRAKRRRFLTAPICDQRWGSTCSKTRPSIHTKTSANDQIVAFACDTMSLVRVVPQQRREPPCHRASLGPE